MPWWFKAAYKLALVGLPIKYTLLRSLSLTKHGGMEQPEWALETFRRHYDAAQFGPVSDHFTVLEMGPGDSLFTALIARSYDATTSYMVDVGPMANTDISLYRGMANYLRSVGRPSPDLQAAQSIDDVLRACGATYLTSGLDSLRSLPDCHIDFIFSNTVLQHVRLNELSETLSQLRRIVKSDGCSVHSLDLRDMMGQSLHHLKFPARVWESALFRKAEFYTNRLRLPEFIDAFRKAGFTVTVDEENRWDVLPVARKKLAKPYSDMSDDDLKPATVRLVARPA